MKLDERPHTVIGVMPARVQFPHTMTSFAEAVALWIPLALTDEEKKSRASDFNYGVIGRLKSGATLAQAQAKLVSLLTGMLFGLAPAIQSSKLDLNEAFKEAGGLVSAMRHAIRAVDAELPVFNIQTMKQVLAASVSQRRFSMLLLAMFALAALLLAAVGLYGVMSYVVSQRTHELGIRMALGAQTRDVLKLVIRQGMTLTLTGVGMGWLGAFALTRWMKSLLFGVSATDPLTFAGLAVLLMLVALLACYLPARKATQVDPTVALRYE